MNMRLMQLGLVCGMLVSAQSVFAAGIPEPVVTVTTNYNGYATVGGKLASAPDGPVGVSVTNGNVKTNTVTDPEGRWSVVFQIRTTSFSVESWSLVKKTDRSGTTTYSMQ